MKPVVRLRDVSFAFDREPVLEHIDLDIAPGEFLGVVGPNGSGKSTLVKLIVGLLRPQSGTVEVMGKPPGQARGAIGYVAQFSSFSRQFPISVEQTVLLGRLGMGRVIGPYTAQDRAAAREALEHVGLWPLRQRPIGALSGGQLQRVLIARALASRPAILLLDEPTSNVDFAAEEDIFDLLKELTADMAIVLVSHDVGFISAYVSRVACVNRTLACHRTSEITPEALEALYGHGVHVIDHSAAGGHLA